MSQNYQAFLDERCKKLGTNHNVNSFSINFAHFSSELLLKEQMIIPVKKTLNNAGHIDAKLIDFSEICQKKKPAKSAVFTDCFLAKFPPEISHEIGRFFYEFVPENPSKFDFFPLKSADFSANFDFFPRKSREISRFFRKFWLFSCENPAKSADFSTNLPLKILRNFAFFSVKYQKHWYDQMHIYMIKIYKILIGPNNKLV